MPFDGGVVDGDDAIAAAAALISDCYYRFDSERVTMCLHGSLASFVNPSRATAAAAAVERNYDKKQ